MFLAPADESTFVVMGAKEFEKALRERVKLGICLGLGAAIVVISFAVIFFGGGA